MIVVSASAKINRPVSEVFDFLSDARNEPKWIPGASNIEMLTAPPVQKGTRFRGQYARAGTVEVELVEFDRSAGLITFRARAKTMDFDDAVKLTPTPEGTLLEATMTAHVKGFMRLFSFMVRKVMEKQFTGNWILLKDWLEKNGN
jgi:carbon monoxide dehydrogenase subunit G